VWKNAKKKGRDKLGDPETGSRKGPLRRALNLHLGIVLKRKDAETDEAKKILRKIPSS